MYELICGILLLILSVVLFMYNDANQKRKYSDKVIEDQTGYINYLLVENKRLREKLYEKYDPQKFRQEWQEESEPVTPVHEGNKGRFSGGSL